MNKNKQNPSLSDFPMPEYPGINIEAQIIADALTDTTNLPTARGILSTEMFLDDQCRRAWCLLCEMQDAHQQIDLVTMHGKIEHDFFINTIIPLTTGIGSLSLLQHSQMLADLSVRREAYIFAVKALNASTNIFTPIDELLVLSEEFATKVRTDLGADADSVAVSQVMNEVAEGIEQTLRDREKGRPTQVPTGFPTLDIIMHGGFKAGNLIVLAARPSVGKTAVMLQMSRSAAGVGIPTSIFSLEMTNSELGQRLLLSTGIVTPLQLTKGEVQWDDFERAIGQFDRIPLYLNDAVRTIDEIVNRIILNHQQRKCGIVFVDYLGLIDTRIEKGVPLNQIIAGITRKLKLVAKSCRVPVVLLCQLNRASASEKRPPALYDLRDSGSIEQDADIVLMLERQDDSKVKGDVPAQLNMWVRKNRNGKAGACIVLQPDSTFSNFEEIEVSS